MRNPTSSLTLAILVALSAAATADAQDHVDSHEHARTVNVGKVTVKAALTKKSVEDLTQPVAVLTSEELDKVKSNSLGETVSKIPGVQTSSFGPGVGRPVIRGMDGSRVQILSNGMGLGDASTVSGDHAVAIEPFLADQIEVLKGPSTLMYGGGAIGGAVNVTDGRIAEKAPADPISGRTEMRFGSVNEERTGVARVTGVGADGRLVIHAEALARNTGDIKIPGYADIHGDEDPHAERGILENSAVRTRSGALGASWVGSRGFTGISASQFNTRYGIPAGAHSHHTEHDDHDDEHAEDPVRIDMDQKRLEWKAGLNDIGVFSAIRPQFSWGHYKHTEFEGDTPGTRFNNRSRELKTDFIFRKFNGMDNAVGFMASNELNEAIGDEAFVPTSTTKSRSLHWYGSKPIQTLQLEAGLRGARTTIHVEGNPNSSFRTVAGAISARYKLTPQLSVTAGLDHAERAPGAEELYAFGPHVATQTFEIGDPTLEIEKANRGEVGITWRSPRINASVSVFEARFDNFLYLQDTAQEIEHLAVRRWVQAPATFRGIDAELKWTIANNDTGIWDWRLYGDTVRASLDRGGNLPRIAPTRFGSEWSWSRVDWRGSLNVLRASGTKHLAANETPTAGYTLVNAHVAWHHDIRDGLGIEIFVDGNNLLNREIRYSTSFLKDVAPQPGRGITTGLRVFF